jgi:AraC-like DNA-binding protein
METLRDRQDEMRARNQQAGLEQRTACRTFEQRGLAFETHYSPAQVTAIWGYSDTKVRRIFEDEPGVLMDGKPSRRSGRKLTRRYYSMRIPESVLRRVHSRLANK